MKKTPSHFTARVEIERQISFFSFGFARVSEVRHIYLLICFSFTSKAFGTHNVKLCKLQVNNYNGNDTRELAVQQQESVYKYIKTG